MYFANAIPERKNADLHPFFEKSARSGHEIVSVKDEMV